LTSRWLQHVANGEAFAAENFAIPGGGITPHIQLFNPAGSGRRVRMRSVHAIGAPTAPSVLVCRHDTALTTLGVPGGFAVENLLGGGVAAVAEMRSQLVAGVLGTPFTQAFAPANEPALYHAGGREWGHDLLEGQGLLLRGVAGVVLIVNWQWVEVPL
jgi:hypothetical protein